jgi:hypothetical protein
MGTVDATGAVFEAKFMLPVVFLGGSGGRTATSRASTPAFAMSLLNGEILYTLREAQDRHPELATPLQPCKVPFCGELFPVSLCFAIACSIDCEADTEGVSRF